MCGRFPGSFRLRINLLHLWTVQAKWIKKVVDKTERWLLFVFVVKQLTEDELQDPGLTDKALFVSFSEVNHIRETCFQLRQVKPICDVPPTSALYHPLELWMYRATVTKSFSTFKIGTLPSWQGKKCRLRTDCGLLFLGLEYNGTIVVSYSFAWWKQ